MKRLLTLLLNTILVGLICMPLSTLAGTKTIGILVFDGVLTSDVTAPMEVFGAASRKSWFSDYEVKLINIIDAPLVTTEEGLRLQVDTDISRAPQLDVLVVPSAYNMKPLLTNTTLINFVRETAAKAEWIASNCSGAFVLAEAGLLDGRKATTWSGGEKRFQKAYPAVDVQFDQNYIVDDKFITSNGSLVSYQAAFALLEKLSSQRLSKTVQDALQYERLFK